jgi:hypothetical protein
MMGAQCPRLDTNSDCLDHDDMVRTTTGNLPLQLDPSRAENYYIHHHTALSAFLPRLLNNELFQNSLFPLHCSQSPLSPFSFGFMIVDRPQVLRSSGPQVNRLPFDFDRHAPKTYHA